jgi:prepilin-type N-terminal cleavage/methylation domain-containing protein
MRNLIKRREGFTLAEVLIVIVLLAILAGVVLFNLSGSDIGAKEATLKSNVSGMREALSLFYNDHGWYPCDARDYNHGGNPATLVQQLTWYTDANGRPNRTKSTNYRFGPYLKKFPAEPITGSSTIVVDATNERILELLAQAVSRGSGTGGWYYEARSGNIVANLGSGYSTAYAGF